MVQVSCRADVVEFEQQPVPSLPDSVYEVLKNSAQSYGTRNALHFFLQGKNYQKTVTLTYNQFFQQVNRAANLFRSLGIGDTDVVTYLLPNLPETMFTLYGAETAGIGNPINPLLDAEHVVDIMNAAESKVLVTLAPFPKSDLWEKATQVISQVPSLETVLTVDLGHYLGLVPRIAVKLTNRRPHTTANVRQLDFNTALKQQPGDGLRFDRSISPSDVASYFHTGGTTGRPKLAQHTHDNEVFNAWALNVNFEADEPRQIFCGLPWFHVNGVIITGLFPLMGGHTIVLGTPSGYRDPGVLPNFWKIVEHYRISFFSSVPTILQMLLEVPRAGTDISSLEFALCGAAPLSVQLFNDFESTTGIKILEGYGFTEGTCANSGNPIYGERKVGSIGLASAHHHMKVVIIDEQTKAYVRDAETDEIGAIVARGRNVFPGYKEESDNKQVFIYDGSHRWYNTGDMGRQDADGFFWITGRSKEMIIRGGHNIDPKMIEEPLSRHPAVAAVAAVARPDSRVGEVPAVYVQFKPGQSVSEPELMEHAKQHIPERAAIPKTIVFVDELPLTAIGKVFKPALVRLQIQEVLEQEISKLPVVESVSVSVDQDPQQGLLAIISARPASESDRSSADEAIRQALSGYTVKYEIED